MQTSRRALIRGAALATAAPALAALPAGSAAAALHGGTDDPVLPLCAEWWRRDREADAVEASGKGLVDREAVEAQEEELAKALDQLHEVHRRLEKTPPVTSAGVFALLAVAGKELEHAEVKDSERERHERLLAVAAASAERLLDGYKGDAP